jgi:SAM-dependent methyltransferase
MEKLTLDKLPPDVLSQIDIERAFLVSRTIIACERLELFRSIEGKRLSAEEIGSLVKIHKRYLRILLDVLVSLGLLDKDGDVYWNTDLADCYFVRGRSIYWTRQFSKECAEDYLLLSVLERALRSGRRCRSILGLPESDYVESMKRNPALANDFTNMLYYFHEDDAAALAEYLPLSEYQTVLDAGGGSGVMSIALAKKNPHLRGCILDIAPVCRVAETKIREAGLSSRLTTLPGDINDPFPVGYDVIMFCDVGPVSAKMLRHAAEALPQRGMIVVVDRFLSCDRTRPLDRLTNQFAGSSFPLTTHVEMVDALKQAGFQNVIEHSGFRDVWFITGRRA